MTDLRQGVTPTQHAVLDLIEREAASWADEDEFDIRIAKASRHALRAQDSRSLTAKRNSAIRAAAMLIDAADEIARLLPPDGDR